LACRLHLHVYGQRVPAAWVLSRDAGGCASSLALFPPFSTGLSEEEASQLAAFAERQIARTRSYEIVSYVFVEEYFVRTNPDSGSLARGRRIRDAIFLNLIL
jgi:hypothetical protein